MGLAADRHATMPSAMTRAGSPRAWVLRVVHEAGIEQDRRDLRRHEHAIASPTKST
jgi:hypothetical protein